MQGAANGNAGRLCGRRERTPRAAAVIAVVVLVSFAAVACSSGKAERPADEEKRTVVPGSNPTAPPLPTLEGDALEPGRYLMTTRDPDFDASHQITIEVPEGYGGFEGSAVLKSGLEETGVGVWAVGYVFADACKWSGTRSAISSADGVVAALAGQKGLRVSKPADVMVDGFAGTYMELTLPARTNLGRCSERQFRVWLDTGGAERYLNNPGQRELLWILEADGVPLVIDAPLDAGAPAQVRAELLRIVRSIRIDLPAPHTILPERASLLDGEVTFHFGPPWESSIGGWDVSPTMLTLDSPYEGSVRVMADPLPVETGCRKGPVPDDAEALARKIRSDPDLEATKPVAADVAGIKALRMDVVAATGASVCQVEGWPLVLTPSRDGENGWAGARLEPGHRMRLYLLDLAGGSARILAIAIAAPEPRFEDAVEAAGPIVDSFEFRTG